MLLFVHIKDSNLCEVANDRCENASSVRVGRDGTRRACGGDYRLEITVLEWLSRARSIVVGFVDSSDTVEDDE